MKDLNERIKQEKDKTWLNDKKHAREIVAEILRFGVSQSHIIHIIEPLISYHGFPIEGEGA